MVQWGNYNRFTLPLLVRQKIPAMFLEQPAPFMTVDDIYNQSPGKYKD